jgi:hypothetical protein
MPTTITPTYTIFYQKPQCCAVTCFQMILFRRGCGLFDLEELAQYFNVKVSKKEKMAFRVPLKTLTRYNHDEGISTLDSVSRVNEFAKKNKLKFHASATKISEIKNISEFIEKNILAGNDIWIEYKSHSIHKKIDGGESEYIHDGLIESISSDRKTVTLIDPEPSHKSRQLLKLSTLSTALSKKYGRETGFVVISK